jgi:predicted dehydrogenase
MNSKDLKALVISVIGKLKKQFEKVDFQYDFDQEGNDHLIVHDLLELECDDKNLEIIGSLFDSEFHDKGIFNVYLSYRNSNKSSSFEIYSYLENEYYQLDPIEIECGTGSIKWDDSNDFQKLFNTMIYSSKFPKELNKTKNENIVSTDNDDVALAA